jgi:ABC-2 type transport system ATP-binding protein/lipopolysaccharide transport system ATP-binding protein
MSEIRLQDVTKTYRMGVGRARVREMLPSPLDRMVRSTFPRWWQKDTFNALAEVSLSVPLGSSLGIVGHNGAGKTTLLKVLAGVTAPTGGRVTVPEKVAALIDLLIGFHPDLTGRENAYLLGAVHGYGRQAMTSRIDRIFDFAEITELADTPVKRYSAGMAARVGFATLTALDVGILLIDEVLAVGDASFQRKCVAWLESFQRQGGTLVFVSHNLGLVRSMTERVIRLDHGRVVDDGATGEVLARYAQATERRDGKGAAGYLPRDARKLMQMRGLHRWGAGGVRIEEVHFEDPDDGDLLEFAVAYSANDLGRASFYLGFVDESEVELGGTTSDPLPISSGGGTVRCSMQPIPLRPGIYFPVVAIMSPDGRVSDRWRLDRAVVVDKGTGAASTLGPLSIPGTWSQVPARRAL